MINQFFLNPPEVDLYTSFSSFKTEYIYEKGITGGKDDGDQGLLLESCMKIDEKLFLKS